MKIRKVFEYTISALLLLSCIIGIYFALTTAFEVGVLWLACLSLIIGYFLSKFVYVFIHELGHLIGGFAGGFKFYSFSVLFFNFIKVNNKLKLRLSFSKTIAGYCQMIPPKSDKLEKSFAKFVGGAYIASWAFLIVSLFIIVTPFIFPSLITSYVIYCLLAPSFISNFPTHFFNFSAIIDNPASDGAIVRGIKANSHSAQLQIKMISIQGLLFSGTRPRDLEASLFENLDFTSETEIYAPIFASYNLSRLLDLGDTAGVIKESDFIKAHYKNTNEVYHELLLCDVFYTELVLKQDVSEAERLYYYIANLLKSQTDISTLRIRMAKEIFIDNAYSKALDTGVLAVNLADSYIAKGGSEMELSIIENLSKIAESKKEGHF
ncbi:MAG: hypothetical protein R3Y45_08275 [Bacillota bacterium]